MTAAERSRPPGVDRPPAGQQVGVRRWIVRGRPRSPSCSPAAPSTACWSRPGGSGPDGLYVVGLVPALGDVADAGVSLDDVPAGAAGVAEGGAPEDHDRPGSRRQTRSTACSSPAR